MRRELLICLLLAGITLGLYWPVGHLGFFDCDDPEYILMNPPVRDGLSPGHVVWAFVSSHSGNWHPVTWLSHMLDCQLFGPNPGAFHLENVLWHTANALLVFLVLRKMTRAVWRSALVAALFAWHPVHLQSVAWIAERKDVLSAFFFLLTLLAYAGYVQRKEGREQRSEGGDQKSVVRGFPPFRDLPASVYYLLSLFCFALGLMSKPMLVTLPAILLLLDFWPLQRLVIYDLRFTIFSLCSRTTALRPPSSDPRPPFPWPLLLEKIPFAGLSLATVKVTFWAQGGAHYIVSNSELPLLERIANVPVFVTWYLEKLFWPSNLTIYYPYPKIPHWEQAGCYLLLALLSVLCLWRPRCNPQSFLLTGWLWFFIMLLPVIGLVQAGTQSIADRYTYLPSIGLFIAVVWGLAALAGATRASSASSSQKDFKLWPAGVTIGAVAVLLACLLDTRSQMKYWRNSVTMYQHALEVNPENNSRTYISLGCAQWREAGDLEGAAKTFRAAWQAESHGAWQSSDGVICYNFGRVLLHQDQPADAQAVFAAALQSDTNRTEAAVFHTYLADALGCEGKTAEAEKEYTLAEQLLPEVSPQRQLIATGRTMAGLRETLKLGPTPEIYAQMAGIEASQGMDRDALEHYLAALKLKPEAPEILNQLAWLMATCVDSKVRDGNQAIQYARRACELTPYGNSLFIGTLAAAYAEVGRFDDAITTAQDACDHAAETGEFRVLRMSQELLECFRAHQTARINNN